MSWGNSPADGVGGTNSYESRDWLMAEAEANRAARLAGHKSIFQRMLEHLRPHRRNRAVTPIALPAPRGRDPGDLMETDSPT